jgi:hypothetical protein
MRFLTSLIKTYLSTFATWTCRYRAGIHIEGLLGNLRGPPPPTNGVAWAQSGSLAHDLGCLQHCLKSQDLEAT